MDALLDSLDLDLLVRVLALGVVLAYALGALSALDAVMTVRTPQGSVAWVLALIAFPLAALPLYWVFGRSRYGDYVRALRDVDARMAERLAGARGGVLHEHLVPADDAQGERAGFQALATFPLTRGNGAQLLIDGEATFEAMLADIARAERYVLFQFYTLRDDRIGRRFLEALEARARAGVRVYVLYDALGSLGLSRRYRRVLADAGVEVSAFPARFGWVRRVLRLNFRNHRKIVVVDGRCGFMGGFNVGDEYLGRDPKLSPWRDTHLRLEGPVVQGLQLSFVRDWHFCTDRTPDLSWAARPHAEDRTALVNASGPADAAETASLLLAHAINSAERRLWIATPYFVPDTAVFSALQIAALRGVDVRVLAPRRSDNVFFRFVPYAYVAEARAAGVQFFLYEPGFMHQKVFLVDDDYAAISSANVDNRSLRLNFEVTVLLADGPFCADVAAMLEADFARATLVDDDEVRGRSLPFRIAVRVTRMLAPIL